MPLVLCFLPLLAPKQDALAAWNQAHRAERIVVVAEPRETPVQREDVVPERWLTKPVAPPKFEGTARPGEFYVFQVSLYNNGVAPISIRSVEAVFGKDAVKAVCLNEAVNVDPSGAIDVPPHRIQPLWIGVEKKDVGVLTGEVRARVALGESGYFQTVEVPVAIHVEGEPLPNEGVDEAWRLSRLEWLLDSDLGESQEPTKGYRAVRRSGNRIDLTATSLILDAGGLPAQVAARGTRAEMLKSPVRFEVDGETWSKGKTDFAPARDDRASWRTVRRSANATLVCEGAVDFDGFLRYHLTLRADKPLALSDARLVVPYREEAAKYQLGLGFRGGCTPPETDWKWNVAHQQDCVWLGDVGLGAQWRFKGANYRRPLVNIYYGFRPLNMPESWGNNGKGGVRVHPVSQGERRLEAYSGPRTLEAGKTLEFDVDVQLTPARPLDTDKQWATRFYHPHELSAAAKIDAAVDTALEDGANVVNIHHRKPINPFINYPFNDFSVPDLKQFVAHAHGRNIRVKLYYTTRELTWQLPEIWALKSFGGSIIQPGPGPQARTVINPNGPHPKLAEALGDDFIPAWTAELDGKYAGKLDLAVITRPDSKWSNYYLNGLAWLVKNVGIDGVYIDDTALDRTSLQRARRILEAGRPAPLIDLHSWNHENSLAANGSSTSIYMELFPYVDRIWFGEGFDYRHATPDYWLVAMSGLPFGVMSEMLEGGGNVWRGMLFGETCRLGWSGDPRSMWKFWDAFGMQGTRMVGWWDPACPVKTSSKDVLATVYEKPTSTLIALANWSEEPKSVHLNIDFKALHLNPTQAHLIAPNIEGFQEAKTWNPSNQIEVPAEKGWLIELNRS